MITLKVVNPKKRRDPKKLSIQDANRRIQKYIDSGIQYEEMVKNQNGCCAICGRSEIELNRRLFVDHCHKTEKLRGLLCCRCNTLLGFGNDNPTIFINAIQYLNKYQNNLE